MALSDFFPENYPDSYSNRIARRVQETRAILRAYKASQCKLIIAGEEISLDDVESGEFIEGKFHPLPGTEHETPFERALRQGE